MFEISKPPWQHVLSLFPVLQSGGYYTTTPFLSPTVQVVMGDDTWMQMAPWAFAAGSHPFPSFNVMDLHTVDEGVWKVPEGNPACLGVDNWLVAILGKPHLLPFNPFQHLLSLYCPLACSTCPHT